MITSKHNLLLINDFSSQFQSTKICSDDFYSSEKLTLRNLFWFAMTSPEKPEENNQKRQKYKWVEFFTGSTHL
ncbi:hypothetical protein C1192_21785 [Escherichia marmotae]|nr:hypothetical protein C1192_21785 [Escherichia marmotae]